MADALVLTYHDIVNVPVDVPVPLEFTMVTDVSFVQLAKAFAPIVFMLYGIVTDWSAEQLANACTGIAVNLGAFPSVVIDVKPVFIQAAWPTLVNSEPLLMVNVVIPVQPWNARSPIKDTEYPR